jgi:hypothetical protein
MPLESSLVFYPRYAIETLRKAWLYYRTWQSARRTLRQVLRNPERMAYTDLALSPAAEEEYVSLDLYSATSGGAGAVARARRARPVALGAAGQA